jgi:hypothetical protein
MNIFNLKNNKVIIDPDKLIIPEFKSIWERDKSKDKENAFKELTYVYMLVDFKSPYQAYPEDIREIKIKEDLFKDKNWKPDDLIKSACKKYYELIETPTLRMLNSARIAVEKLSNYFKVSNPNDKSYTANLEKLGKIIESLDKLEEKVKKEQTSETKVRGGGIVKERER